MAKHSLNDRILILEEFETILTTLRNSSDFWKEQWEERSEESDYFQKKQKAISVVYDAIEKLSEAF